MMENRDKIQQEEDISNPEQFQVGRSPEEEKNTETVESTKDEDSGYTAQETEFADGKNTKLNEAIDNEYVTENSDETVQKTENAFENQDLENDKDSQPEVNDI